MSSIFSRITCGCPPFLSAWSFIFTEITRCSVSAAERFLSVLFFSAGFCGADCPARVVEGLDFFAAVRLFFAAFACGFFVEVVFFRIINDRCSRHRCRRQGLCAAPDRRLCLSRRNRCKCAVHKDEHQTAHQEYQR